MNVTPWTAVLEGKVDIDYDGENDRVVQACVDNWDILDLLFRFGDMRVRLTIEVLPDPAPTP